MTTRKILIGLKGSSGASSGRDSFLPAAIRELARELHASSLAVSGRPSWVTRESPCPVLVVHAGEEEQMVL